MRGTAIELKDVGLDFPMVRGSQKLLDVLIGFFTRRSRSTEPSNASPDLGASVLGWPAVQNADCYRVLIRNDDIGDVVDKIEVRGTRYSFDWNVREEGARYRYRIQFRVEPGGDWRDTGPYAELPPPEKTDSKDATGVEEVDDVRKRHFRAIDGISLKIKRGEVIGIIGENGSGKSTLLRLIGGVYAPDFGEVITEGRVTMLISLGAGFESHLTGRDNVMITGSIYGVEQKKLERMVPDIIEYSGINKEFVDQPLRTYSSGMRSRLGFSIISHLEPEILLLDEIMSAGDYDFRKKSEKRILEMVEGDATVVIVSHDVDVLKRLCGRVFAMREGKLVTGGSFEEAVAVYRS